MFEWFAARQVRRGVACGLLVGVLGLVLSVVPAVLDLDETIGLGALFAARGPIPPPADVVLVNISRDAAAGIGQSEEIDEWPRRLHADLIDSLSAAGVAAIAFDIIFDEPRPDDPALAAAIRRAGNVLLVERVMEQPVGGSGVRAIVESRRLPVPELRAAAAATAPFTLPKVPNRVSQFWTFGRAVGDVPSLPVTALQVYLLPHYDELAALVARVRPALVDQIPASAADIGGASDFGSAIRRIRSLFQRDPDLEPALRAAVGDEPHSPSAAALGAVLDLYGGPNSRYLNFYGPPRTIRTIPYDLASSSASTLDVKGKVVFVGFAEPRQSEEKDIFYSVFSQSNGSNLSGVEIGATAFANLLEQRSLIPLPMPTHLLLVLGWGLLIGFVAAGASSTRIALALAALAAAFYAGAAYWLFALHAVWLPVLVPLFVQVPVAALLGLSLNYLRLMRQRERVQAALGYYVPRAFVNRLAHYSVSEAASRQLLHGTCLFTDAEEYTTVSEALRPEELATLMNDYYRVMFGVVERHGGMVSDTSGDSMVALWASAKPDESSRAHACRAALEIVEAVADFNRGRGGLRLPTRVGLESGEVLLGNIGAEQRFEYRAIGDIVNTASRLQGLNRLLGTRVLLSQATVAGAPGLIARNVGVFLLRGKRTPIRVFEPFGFGDGARGSSEVLGTSFAAALELFENERWTDAERAFAEICARFPADGPSAFYAGLCAEYRSRPTPWAGAISVAVK